MRYNLINKVHEGDGFDNRGVNTVTDDPATGHSIPVAFHTNMTSQAVNRTYAAPVYSALDASRPFLQVGNGFASQPSDGLTQLDAGHAMTTAYTDAANGNLVQTTQVDLSHGRSTFTMALGIGTTQS